MKNYIIAGSLLVLAGAFAFPALATVGGPTFVYDFKYNPADESVYFTEISQSGRGCPPMLFKLSLNSGKTDAVLDCNETEDLLQGGTTNIDAVIADMTNGYKPLTAINLPKNNISIDIDFVRDEYLEGETDWLIKKHFTATVYQNGKKVTEFPITGCSMEQPFLWSGYAIPGFDKKIVLLLSAKGDCWEGGYIYESLHMVGGVAGLDKTYAVDGWKNRSALTPSEATLMVFEKDEVTPVPETKDCLPEDSDCVSPQTSGFGDTTLLMVAIGFGALVFGFAIGKILSKPRA